MTNDQAEFKSICNGFDPTLRALQQVANACAFHPKLSGECFSVDQLMEFASSPRQQFFEFQHVQDCPRCGATYDSCRSMLVLKRLPRKWNLAISLESLARKDDGFSQLIGFVDLESRCFEISESDFDWRPSRLRIRVNVVVDATNKVFSIVLLDVCEEIQHVHLITKNGKQELDAVEPHGTHEILLDDDLELVESNQEFIDRILGATELVFEFQGNLESFGSMPTLRFLELFDAVESEFNYQLPSGLISKTYLNAAKLCESSVALSQIAKRLDAVLPDDFDLIVSNSWPMANVARRIARIRNLRAGKACVRDVLCEGYNPTVLTDDVPPGAKVVVVADVIVSGAQVDRIRDCVGKRKADVVGIASLAISSEVDQELRDEFIWLCELDMELSREASGSEWRETRVFNPLANCMSQKREQGRSPSQFFVEDEEARELWSFMNRVVERTRNSNRPIYKRHFVEGNTHYTQFIDTGALVEHPEFGQEIVERIREKMFDKELVADVFLVPDRKRAKQFANELARALDLNFDVKIVHVKKNRQGFWEFPKPIQKSIEHKRVLFVDSAIGHGKTVDLFEMAASHFGAISFGAVTILSRLCETAENSLSRRLTERFCRLFNLPIRPVVIRGDSKTACPYCAQKQAISDAASASGSSAIEGLLNNKRRISPVDPEENKAEQKPDLKQMSLLDNDGEDFVANCRPSVARGLTLHSLYGAKNNGMAPLSLPELINQRVPSAHKKAMVDDLPFGVSDWSGPRFDDDLYRVIESTDVPGVWSASAFVLAKESRQEWVGQLVSFIDRSKSIRTAENKTFWRQTACSMFLWARDADRNVLDLTLTRLENLRQSNDSEYAREGIQQVAETINAAKYLASVENLFEKT